MQVRFRAVLLQLKSSKIVGRPILAAAGFPAGFGLRLRCFVGQDAIPMPLSDQPFFFVLLAGVSLVVVSTPVRLRTVRRCSALRRG
jgi:hypothetical protein